MDVEPIPDDSHSLAECRVHRKICLPVHFRDEQPQAQAVLPPPGLVATSTSCILDSCHEAS